MKSYKTFLDEAKDWKSLPDDYWVLVQGRKVIKSGKTKPKFTSSKGQELMTVKNAKKMMMEAGFGKHLKQFINEGKVLGQTLTISSAPDKAHPNSGDTTILKWGKKTIDIFNLPNGAGKLEKLIPKPIVRSKDKDWEPFIILAIGMGLL